MRFRSSEHTNKPKLDVVWSNQPKTVYFLKDHLGSVRATVDQTGAVVGYDDYDPWGYILEGRTMASTILPATTRNKFTGKEWDDEFGVNWFFFPARPYDPEIARWLVRDPLADKHSGWSPYHYTFNNPIRFIDPKGLDTLEVNLPRDRRQQGTMTLIAYSGENCQGFRLKVYHLALLPC